MQLWGTIKWSDMQHFHYRSVNNLFLTRDINSKKQQSPAFSSPSWNFENISAYNIFAVLNNICYIFTNKLDWLFP